MSMQTLLYLIAVTGLLCAFQCKNKNLIESNRSVSTTLSFTNNPYNNWQIGYSRSDTLDPLQFQLSTFARTGSPIPLWHPADHPDLYYPYTGQNTDTVSILDVSNQWALRKGQIAMEGSNIGQYSMLRFISPLSGKYRIKVVFEGVHFGLSTTDVHILLNFQHLFKTYIEGYGGDPAFHAIAGAHPSATYEDVLQLQKGDILTFAVGYGKNKNHINDTTGLSIVLELV